MDVRFPALKTPPASLAGGGAAVVALALVTLGLSRLQPAAPLVEKSAIWMDTVKRGEMLRQVRGNGTLVPEDIRWIPDDQRRARGAYPGFARRER